MIIVKPNILMVGGNARKSGKTTYIRQVLTAYGNQHRIAAIKAALYDDAEDFGRHYPQALPTGFHEIKEDEPSEKKDSGRYLASGATESWFFAALLQNLEQVLERISAISRDAELVVLESNALRKNIQPGVFVMINNPARKAKMVAREVWHQADLFIDTQKTGKGLIGQSIGITGNRWFVKT